MRIAFLILCLFFGSFIGRAQLIDSIRHDFASTPKLYVSLDTRNSFITHSIAKIRGLRAGLSFNGRARVGLSYNWLRTDLDRTTAIYRNDSLTTLNGGIRFWFVAPFLEYALIQRKHYELEFPFRIGIGRSGIVYEDEDGTRINRDFQTVVMYEPGVVFTYRFLRYFGASLGVGARLMIKPNKKLNEKFTSPVYSLGIRFYASDAWKDIRGRLN